MNVILYFDFTYTARMDAEFHLYFISGVQVVAVVHFHSICGIGVDEGIN